MLGVAETTTGGEYGDADCFDEDVDPLEETQTGDDVITEVGEDVAWFGDACGNAIVAPGVPVILRLEADRTAYCSACCVCALLATVRLLKLGVLLNKSSSSSIFNGEIDDAVAFLDTERCEPPPPCAVLLDTRRTKCSPLWLGGGGT